MSKEELFFFMHWQALNVITIRNGEGAFYYTLRQSIFKTPEELYEYWKTKINLIK